MIRAVTIMAVAASGLSASAFAEPAKPVEQPQADHSASLKSQSGAQEARQHLLKQGYTNVSELAKDEDGRWTGTATKDGKTIFVAIDLRGQGQAKVETR